jgi:hypothetical protein
VTAWFGQAWDAPVCEGAPQLAVPVGEPCLRCDVKITEGDRGVLIPYGGPAGGGDPALAPWHRGCFLAEIVGPSLAASLRDEVRGGG